MTTIRAFFLQIRALFSNFQKEAGEIPLPPSSYAPVINKEMLMKSTDKNNEVSRMKITVVNIQW